MTCEGCKGFFRRAMKRNARLRCPFRKGTCEITRKTRRQCQACRLRKCLESGMKKEMIMSDAAVEQRRALIRKKKRDRIGTQSAGAKGLTEEQRTMIKELMDAQMKTFDTTFSHFKNFRLPEVLTSGREIPESLQTPLGEEAAEWNKIREDLCSLKVSLQLRGEDGSVWNYKPPAASSGKEIFSLLPHMADMSTYMFKGIINFAKVISHFRDWDLGVRPAVLLLGRPCRWLPAASPGACAEIPLHAEEAAAAQGGVCADAGHLPFLPRPARCGAAWHGGPAAGTICHRPEGLHRVQSAPTRPPVPVPEDHGDAHGAPQHQRPAHQAAAAHPGHPPLRHAAHAGVVQHLGWLSPWPGAPPWGSHSQGRGATAAGPTQRTSLRADRVLWVLPSQGIHNHADDTSLCAAGRRHGPPSPQLSLRRAN
ncbi:nuclear receptor subfamily 1 group I member 2 isoform X1 [Rhinolophus ferrumequinum]|uniref:nuclear receptor subfamily 1 group I member 2 isoform X1 n=1 Tax=Rhinolophus ferrumequinum TaxID=59479 RepID=UPI00140F7014|nr:nuclear receptor subfamily 1 group I member 2 isoform X1 [Rhinolophus ferrumequinum]